MLTPTKEFQQSATPEQVLQFLREGNYRFVNNLKTNHNFLQQIEQTSDGQYPLAVIANCIDSRTPTELIFDQGLGGVFGIRIAGSIISDHVLASMEFACKVAGSKLIVVLGHTKCGAIKGACDNVQLGNLTTLLNKIQPSIYLEKTVKENRTASNAEFVEKVTVIHVRRSLEAIIEQSQVLREMIEAGEIGLVGGIYDIETGAVNFFEDTFMSGDIKHFYLVTKAEETQSKIKSKDGFAANAQTPRG